MSDKIVASKISPSSSEIPTKEEQESLKSENMESRIQLIKQEIDALQISFMNIQKPWYHDLAVIVATLSFIFSFSTTLFSYYQSHEQGIRDQHSELRLLIQRINALPKENAELIQKFKDDSLTSGGLSGVIAQENMMLATQAEDLISQLDDSGRITPAEYYAVATSLANAGLVETAIDLSVKALDMAEDANNKVSILRQLGHMHFNIGDLVSGRHFYSAALDIFKEFDDSNAYQVVSTHALTEMFWSQAEYGQRQCQEAKKHFREATRHANNLPPAPITAQLQQQINSTGHFINNCL